PDPSTAVSFEIVDPSGEYVYDVVTTVRTEFGPKDGNSAFEMPIHPGEYTIEARADRYATLSTTITVPEAPRHEVRLEMSPTFGTLVVRVTGPDGQPVEARASVNDDR
ncbi:unnamed protein product, partial [Ectocarpus fasciculatus]